MPILRRLRRGGYCAGSWTLAADGTTRLAQSARVALSRVGRNPGLSRHRQRTGERQARARGLGVIGAKRGTEAGDRLLQELATAGLMRGIQGFPEPLPCLLQLPGSARVLRAQADCFSQRLNRFRGPAEGQLRIRECLKRIRKGRIAAPAELSQTVDCRKRRGGCRRGTPLRQGEARERDL